ncbi:hypothetical protein AC529_10780, partial [Thermobifida cellulosilytica TB100]
MDGGGGGSGTAAGGWGLLRAHGPFRVLCGARTVSVLGESAALVALLLFAAGSTGRAVAALLLVGDFAPALLAPLAGVAADRFDLRRVMAGCEAVQGAALAAAAVWLPPLPPLLVLVAVRAVAGQVFLPASRAAVPALVRGGAAARRGLRARVAGPARRGAADRFDLRRVMAGCEAVQGAAL